jgi:hypothetical protein
MARLGWQLRREAVDWLHGRGNMGAAPPGRTPDTTCMEGKSAEDSFGMLRAILVHVLPFAGTVLGLQIHYWRRGIVLEKRAAAEHFGEIKSSVSYPPIDTALEHYSERYSDVCEITRLSRLAPTCPPSGLWPLV